MKMEEKRYAFSSTRKSQQRRMCDQSWKAKVFVLCAVSKISSFYGLDRDPRYRTWDHAVESEVRLQSSGVEVLHS